MPRTIYTQVRGQQPAFFSWFHISAKLLNAKWEYYIAEQFVVTPTYINTQFVGLTWA